MFETDKKWALTIVPTSQAKIFVHSTDEVTSHDFRPTFIWDVGFAIDLLITMKQTYTTDDARQVGFVVAFSICCYTIWLKLTSVNAF